MTTLSTTHHRLWLEVDGIKERLPLVSFVCTFALNQIPMATVQLATSRDAVSGKVAAATRNFSALKSNKKANIFFQPSGETEPGVKWPSSTVKVFEGKIAGPGFVTGNGLTLQLHIRHWLADLDNSSALSAVHHPQNPISMIAPAAMLPILKAGADPMTTGIGDMIDAASLAKVSEDVWALSIKEGLCQLATQAHVRLDGELSPCEVTKIGENTQALEALRRLDGPSPTCTRAYSTYSFPLALQTAEINVPSSVVEAVQRALRDDTAESFAYQTFWGKLVGYYSPQLMCHVVPLVDHALFVPIVPGSRGLYCKEIKKEDITGGRASFPTPRPLRAVGVYSELGSPTRFMSPDFAKLMGVGGCYFAKEPDASGVILTVSAPPWLSNVPLAGHVPGVSAGFDKTIGTATTPKGEDAALRPAGASETDILGDTAKLANRYAQAVFVMETLRGREASVVSRLRFDIAPGATVRLHPASLLHVDEEAAEIEQPIVGLVSRVSIAISAEQPSAVTTFQLSFLRTEDENESDDTSIDRHPLFDKLFVGAPLVDELQLPKCA